MDHLELKRLLMAGYVNKEMINGMTDIRSDKMRKRKKQRQKPWNIFREETEEDPAKETMKT